MTSHRNSFLRKTLLSKGQGNKWCTMQMCTPKLKHVKFGRLVKFKRLPILIDMTCTHLVFAILIFLLLTRASDKSRSVFFRRILSFLLPPHSPTKQRFFANF